MAVKSKPKTVRFVPLAEEHIAKILEIEKEANGAPWSEQSFKNELTNDCSIFRVMLAEGEPVAYGGVWNVVDEAHITTVAVRKDLRGQGLGERMMVELLGLAQEAGMLCSTLEVRAGNDAAIKLYEKLGYVRSAVRKGYYPDNREDAVIMWLYDLPSWSRP